MLIHYSNVGMLFMRDILKMPCGVFESFSKLQRKKIPNVAPHETNIPSLHYSKRFHRGRIIQTSSHFQNFTEYLAKIVRFLKTTRAKEI